MTPAQEAAIARIEAMEAQESAAKPGMVDIAMDQLGSQVRSAAGPLGIDALNNYASERLQDYNKTVKPAPAGQLPQASDLYTQASEQGRKMMEPKPPSKPQPLQQVEVVNGVKYVLTNGKYVKAK